MPIFGTRYIPPSPQSSPPPQYSTYTLRDREEEEYRTARRVIRKQPSLTSVYSYTTTYARYPVEYRRVVEYVYDEEDEDDYYRSATHGDGDFEDGYGRTRDEGVQRLYYPSNRRLVRKASERNMDYAYASSRYEAPAALRHQPSQQYLSVRPAGPTGRPYASASSMDLRQAYTSGGQRPGQGWRSVTAPPIPQPAPLRHVASRGVEREVAFGDRVTMQLNDVLAAPGDVGVDELDSRSRSPGFSLASKSRAKAADASEGGGIINWKKSWLYANARLPPEMVTFRAYLPTWTLICRAAQASMDVYHRPPKGQREYYMAANPSKGTKASIIKSQAVDDTKLIIVAIRGSQWKYVDWAVNLTLAPTPPTGFLDDTGNACHSGFLEVARAMVAPVAEQLRKLVENDPSACASSSLLFTGHSAGGAVASLLYMHMLARTVESDLTVLRGLFKRMHCITFGTPPLSLLPLQKPRRSRSSKDIFYSFVNEGDLITRASRQYLASLVKLLAAPAPLTKIGKPGLMRKSSRQTLKAQHSKLSLRSAAAAASSTPVSPLNWRVPDSTLSNAGRLVLLREKPGSTDRAIEATQLTDEMLRGVLFGDPAMHAMSLYKQRVDELAFAAVSGRDGG